MASIGEQILAIFTGALNLDVEALATVVGVWDTARQTVRTIATGVAGAAMQGTMNEVMAKYLNVPLSPAVLADMAIRNLSFPRESVLLDPLLVQEAGYSGISPERFAALVQDTGESYGIVDALRLWHRGSYLVAPVANPDQAVGQAAYVAGDSLGSTYGIDETELDTVIYYSRVRNEFLPDLKQLSWDTMSTADAIETAVKGRATTDLAKAWFQAAGGMPEQFEILYESAGDSVGVEHAVVLHSHGLITDDELQAVILQSRINPRFYDVALLADKKWLNAFQIRNAVAAGDVDVPTAVKWMVQNGYPEDQSTALVTSAVKGTIAKPKAEAESVILQEYEAQIITEAQATAALKSLGYTDAAVPFILEGIVAKRVLSMRNAAITRTRTAFIDYLITEDQARADLQNLGIPQAAIDQFVVAWTIEQQTNVKRLSAAQVGKLLEEGLMDENNAVTRWTQMGYAPEEAQLLTLIYPYGSKGAIGQAVQVTTVPPSGAATTPGPTDVIPPPPPATS